MHQLQNLFQVPVYKGHLEQDFKIPDLWSGLSKNVWSGESGFSTAQCDLQLHDSSVEVCDIIEALFPHVIEYWNTLGYAPAQIRPTASWANWHEAGDHTSEHSHCDGTSQTHIASVYYIAKGEGRPKWFIEKIEELLKETIELGPPEITSLMEFYA